MLYFSFIYLFVLVFFGKRFERKTRFYLGLFPFILIIFLRFGIGADYFSYEHIYYSINPTSLWKSLDKLPKIEFLYVLLNYIAIKIGISYHIFVGLLATSMIILTLKWLYDNSPNFELSVLLHLAVLFIYWNTSALRQGIVLTGLIYIYFNPKLKINKRDKYSLTAILFFMHPTTIIVPILYFISSYDWDKIKIFRLVIPIPFVRLLFHQRILYFFYKIPYMNKVLKYADYNSIRLISSPSLMRFSFFIFILYHYDKLVEKYPEYKRMFIFSLLSLISYFYLPTAMVIGTRTTIFGFALIILIFPMILELYRNQKLYKLVFIGLLGIATLSYYNELSKLVARTGYDYSITRLNFETIFQKNRINFRNMYTFKYMVNEENNNIIANSDLLDRVNSEFLYVENPDRINYRNIPVRFAGYGGAYGLINDQGQIVQLPTSVYPEIKVWERDKIRLENNINRFIINRLDMETIRDFPISHRFNMNTLVDVLEYKRHYYDNYRYLRLSTNYENYFVFMKDGEVLVDRLYNSIIPFTEEGIAMGYTNNYIEFINENGEIIWIEPR